RFSGSDPRTWPAGAGRPDSALAELLADRVQGPSLDVALNPAQVLAHEREDEALDAEDEEHGDATEERPWEVRPADPEDDAVDPQGHSDERAENAEADPDPLDRLRPETGEDVERKPREAER